MSDGGGVVRKRRSFLPREGGPFPRPMQLPFYVQEGTHTFLLGRGEYPVRLKVAL
jgi:hypothetical protein